MPTDEVKEVYTIVKGGAKELLAKDRPRLSE